MRSQTRQACRHATTNQTRRVALGSSARHLSATFAKKIQSLAASPTDVFVLDFDGVLIDSEPEVSASGFEAAESYWPELFADVGDQHRFDIREGLKKVRPVLISGHELLVMVRLLNENPGNADLILKSWPTLYPSKLKEWNVDEADIKNFFETYRNDMMARSDGSWLALHEVYPGVKEALTTTMFPFYLASSKAGHRVSKLMASAFGIDMPMDSPRLLASLIPPNEKKVEALRQILSRPICASATLHFVDDRLETLQAVLQAPDLATRCRCYLADWGYSTAEQREEARHTPGITTINLKRFCELLQWGLVMEVDDGCEPTAEEVTAGVQTTVRALV